HFSSREANRADQPEIQSFLFDKHTEQTCQTFRRAGCFADPGGVFPMVIATGAGAGSRQAIGITTFSGMLLATLVGMGMPQEELISFGMTAFLFFKQPDFVSF
ncbi:MAG: hypothetical protein IKB22_04285, partial [Lentisphaeria bacterium]|nr:hypothetical protein [Lentisphaeria bacterium]